MVLTEQQITEKLGAIRGWGLFSGQLQKTFTFPGFEKALIYINQLAVIAENQDHYPDMRIYYNKVTISLSTHSEDGITEKDFKLAKECDQLAVNML